MSFKEQPLNLKIFIITITLSGVVFLYFFQPEWQVEIIKGLLFLIFLNIVAEHLAVPLPRGESYVSVSFAVLLAAILIFGPGVGAWVAFFGTLTLKDLTSMKVYYYRTFFNCSQMALAAGAAGLVFLSLGGNPGVIQFPQDLLPIVGACGAYLLINLGAIIMVLSMSQNVSPWELWKINFRWAIPNYAALAPLGIVISITYLYLGIIGVGFLIVPLLLARYTFLQYMEMRNTYLSTIKALTKAIDAKDHYTHGHSERVANYAVAIGKEMKLPADYLERLEYISLLHDVGKVGISENILNKPSSLLEEEMAAIKQHPSIGADIIKEVKLIGNMAEDVRLHHEWINGNGYPRGVKEENIPLGARIIGVADAYDAMTTNRSYRKAFSQDKAVEELKRCAGTQFDPEVVDAFIRVLGREDLS